MENKTNVNSKINEFITLIDDAEAEAEMGSAFASVMLNPGVAWAKFILTDDRPNGNKQRVPQNEFANLIRSGIFMPLKMAIKEIKDGHDEAVPLGVITHLKEEDNKVLALAALWSRERPEDVEMLKKRFKDGSPINVSWEIQYADSVIEEDGVQALLGTELSGATIVGMPAYAGRTPLIAFAAKKWSQPYIASLPDSSFLYIEPDKEKDSSGRTLQQFRHFPVIGSDNQVDITRLYSIEEEIGGSTLADSVKERVRTRVKELIDMHKSGASLDTLSKNIGLNPIVKENKLTMDEKEFNELKAKLDETEAKVADLETKLAAANSALSEKETTLASKDSAIAELQAYKDGIEGEKATAAKMQAIKEKFASAKLEKPEDYFDTNKEFLMGLSDSQLDFMVQELASFAKNETSSSQSSQIPNLLSGDNPLSKEDILKALRERTKK